MPICLRRLGLKVLCLAKPGWLVTLRCPPWAVQTPQDSPTGHEVRTRVEAGNTWGRVSPPGVPGHLLVGLRLQTASSRATTGGSERGSMLSTRGSVRWALSGVQGQGCGRAWGPAWARAGTQGEQAAGAAASLLQPSEVAAEGSGEVGTGAQGRAGGRWPKGERGGGAGLLRTAAAAAVPAWGCGWRLGMTGSRGELPAHPAWPGEAGNALP